MLDLEKHKDHKLENTQIGNNMELECLTCNEVLLTQPIQTKREVELPKACSMDGEGCLSCGS